MQTGAEATRAEVLIFFDADLIGLTPAHVENLLLPITRGEADMALGVFRGGRGATTLAQILVPTYRGSGPFCARFFCPFRTYPKRGTAWNLPLRVLFWAKGCPCAASF